MLSPHFNYLKYIFFSKVKRKDSCTVSLSHFMFLRFRGMSIRMPNIDNHANETEESLENLSTIFVFSRDYLN